MTFKQFPLKEINVAIKSHLHISKESSPTQNINFNLFNIQSPENSALKSPQAKVPTKVPSAKSKKKDTP